MKRARRRFTLERGNLTNEHTFKYSTLANTRAVVMNADINCEEGVEGQEDKKVVVQTLKQENTVNFGKRTDDSNNPKGMFKTEAIDNKHNRHAVEEKNIRAALDGQNYRRDLTKDAIRRYRRLRRAGRA